VRKRASAFTQPSPCCQAIEQSERLPDCVWFYSLLQPARILPGLTATPERTDAGDILHYFDNHIAVEMRLWGALERGLLCPFQYFGLHDNTDLSSVRWSRKGYDTAELERLYTGDDARVRLVLEQVRQKHREAGAMRALGFCVSIAHAEFMARRS